ncbi:UNVERIFIED_ORG: hypothetical protein J2X79_003791 [Arthrobacter globiformis]|nr:hypothetical protein [Arthrobacter globiformis]
MREGLPANYVAGGGDLGLRAIKRNVLMPMEQENGYLRTITGINLGDLCES